MAQLVKSIDLYLMDGTAAGRPKATLSNWNCNACKIPRADLKHCDDLPELYAPGVQAGQPFVCCPAIDTA